MTRHNKWSAIASTILDGSMERLCKWRIVDMKLLGPYVHCVRCSIQVCLQLSWGKPTDFNHEPRILDCKNLQNKRPRQVENQSGLVRNRVGFGHSYEMISLHQRWNRLHILVYDIREASWFYCLLKFSPNHFSSSRHVNTRFLIIYDNTAYTNNAIRSTNSLIRQFSSGFLCWSVDSGKERKSVD